MVIEKKGVPKKARPDATVSFQIQDPALDNLSFSAQRISALQKKLEGCSVVLNDAGVRFHNFVKNLRGMTPIDIKGFKFIALRTRSSLFVLTTDTPENLYEIAPGLMSVDFKKRCIIRTETGKTMYISMIDSGDLKQMMSVAIQEKARVAKVDSIAVPSDGMILFEEFQEKLAACTVILSLDPFDPKEFAGSLKFVSGFSDPEGRSYYFITAGDDERAYMMYVNSPEVSSLTGIQLGYENDTCILMAED
ncbi:MAG: hypothetical protein ABH983_00710 [Candidatus Micrarchaeota archaeon]|nr:hypothetical protein [Candidatus Micrarchaeota archaeon]